MIILMCNHMFLGPNNSNKLFMRLPWVCNSIEIQYGVQYGYHFRVFHFLCSRMITLVSEQMCIGAQNSQNNPGDVFPFTFKFF